MDKVIAKRCDSYKQEKINKAVGEIFDRAGGMGALVKPGQMVALKANLITRKKPAFAATTHPSLVEAVAGEVMKAGGRPVICDSPGGPYSKTLLKAVYRETGMAKVAERTGAELNYNLEEVLMPCPGGEIYNRYPVIKPLADADVIIGLSKLKTHGMTTFTGAVKLFYGAIPGLKKAEYHFNLKKLDSFSRLLVDLVTMLKPAFSIMDGITGMEGDGPLSGHPRHAGWLLAGKNPFTLDAAACRLIGINPQKIAYLKLAQQRGRGEDMNSLQTVGDDFQPLAQPFKLPAYKSVEFSLPPGLKKVIGHRLQPRPVFHRETCRGCGDCSRACPAGAITISGGKAEVELEKCIRCFCCHELCLWRAVSVYQWWPARKIFRLRHGGGQ